MSTTISSDGLPPRRKKMLWNAWHRGTKEMDILLGEFADARIAELSDADLADLEALMEETDRDLFAWIVGSEPTPPARQTAVWAEFLAFHKDKHRPAA